MTIDWWTLGLQTVNVTVLVWLLARFFWRPLAGIIERRRAEAQRLLDEAEASRRTAAAALAEIEQRRRGDEAEREAILADAHRQAAAARAALLAAADKELAERRAAAETAIAAGHAAAEKAWSERAGRLGVEIARRLLQGLTEPVAGAAFLHGLLDQIQALPETVRNGLAGDGAALRAVTATPLSPADQEQYGALIATAVAGRPQLSFEVDPALIAGLELHGPHLAVTNSWRADLDRIMAELAHDRRS